MLRRTALVLFTTSPLLSLASEASSVAAARPAVLSWLKVLDAADTSSTWEQAASGFKKAVTSQQWAQASTAVRAPLGIARQRNERSSQFSNSLLGAPDGEYVVFQFQTVFENKAAAVETVTAVKDIDGAWRVTGYFIK